MAGDFFEGEPLGGEKRMVEPRDPARRERFERGEQRKHHASLRGERVSNRRDRGHEARRRDAPGIRKRAELFSFFIVESGARSR